MNLLKRFLLPILFLLLTPKLCAAEANALIVLKNNGSKLTFVLSKKPELSFANRILQITYAGDKTLIELEEVEQFYFDGLPTDISSPTETGGQEFKISYPAPDLAVVEGLNEKADVRLYSLKGIPYPKNVRMNRNQAEISLSSLPKGIYIININSTQSIKIIRK